MYRYFALPDEVAEQLAHDGGRVLLDAGEDIDRLRKRNQTTNKTNIKQCLKRRKTNNT